jgi:hypothetical protein
MNERDTMRWVWRGSALAALLIGWVFIAWKNHFHITAPLVFVCLGYLAVVATVYNLWRTGAAAVAGTDDDGDSTWAKPTGALGELEREKRTLLKAIKEAEFDHQMGKLSQRDVDDMIRTYRARAIEVIKEIDRLGHGAVGSTREQIMREVRARLELEAKSQKKPEPKAVAAPAAGAAQNAGASQLGSKPGKGKKKAGKNATPNEPVTAEALAAAPPDAAAPRETTPANAADAAAAATVETGSNGAAAHGPAQAAAAAAQATLDDEAMDADSTTTVEPKRDDPAKEATP